MKRKGALESHQPALVRPPVPAMMTATVPSTGRRAIQPGKALRSVKENPAKPIAATPAQPATKAARRTSWPVTSAVSAPAANSQALVKVLM
ncbi:hypothetical protein ABEG17_15380 [Pedococcus sp. KACC 23699]|uniref:Uncharacterized protein n=1 Tax=Pedococcus sp. KACC 23699 TaxID=3149228 RepID=A0AAU7JRL5_9MICO